MSTHLPGEGNAAPAGDADLRESSPEAQRTLAFEEYRTLLQAAEQLFDDMDRALASLDEGTYGNCEVCGTKVDDRDLMEDPLETRCAPHRVARAG